MPTLDWAKVLSAHGCPCPGKNKKNCRQLCWAKEGYLHHRFHKFLCPCEVFPGNTGKCGSVSTKITERERARERRERERKHIHTQEREREITCVSHFRKSYVRALGGEVDEMKSKSVNGKRAQQHRNGVCLRGARVIVWNRQE